MDLPLSLGATRRRAPLVRTLGPGLVTAFRQTSAYWPQAPFGGDARGLPSMARTPLGDTNPSEEHRFREACYHGT